MVRFWNTSRPSVNSMRRQAQLDDQAKCARAAVHEAVGRRGLKAERLRRAA